MSRKAGLPDFMKYKHDDHFVDEISLMSKTTIIRNIPINKITPGVIQPRKDFGDLNELAESIKEKGIIEPIIVRSKNGRFEIIAGERRYRAAKIIGLKELPCIERNSPDNEALELAIVENLQRKDLNIFESAYSFKCLSDIYGYTHMDIANKIGKSRTTVSELLRINDLPDDILKKCIELNIVSKSFVLELVKLNDKKKMIKVLEEYSEKPFSRDEIKKKRNIKTKKIDRENKPLKFNFVSDNKEIKIGFNIKSKEINRDEIIEILEKLINDIREDKIKEFKPNK